MLMFVMILPVAGERALERAGERAGELGFLVSAAQRRVPAACAFRFTEGATVVLLLLSVAVILEGAGCRQLLLALSCCEPTAAIAAVQFLLCYRRIR
jgi:hypothetical protein